MLLSIFFLAYLYPDYFWQLNYSTDFEELLESETPIVHGNEALKLSGDGTGYLKYKAGITSATLATFQSQCFIDIQRCTSGITYAFWVLLERVVTSSEGTYQILSLKSNEYDGIDSRLRVMFEVRKGTSHRRCLFVWI